MPELPNATIERCYYTRCPICEKVNHYYFASDKGMSGTVTVCVHCGEKYILRDEQKEKGIFALSF